MKFRRLVATGTSLVAALLTARAQLPLSSPAAAGMNSNALSRLHAQLDQFVDSGRQAGIVTMISRNGRLVDVHTHGWRDREKRLPMERDTICRIYSMSKVITSVGVLSLWEEGRFQLDDPVQRYLPEWTNLTVLTGGTAAAPVTVPAARPITIKHLLTHTSGLAYDFSGGPVLSTLYKDAGIWDGPDLRDFTARVARLPLKHQPGEAFTYGVNTDILGALIERVTGRGLEEFLQERVCRPLGMVDTSFTVPAAKLPRLAITYRTAAGGGLEPADSLSPRRFPSGGGGLFSTAGDYLRFGQMLVDHGKFEGHRILGRKTIELMRSNHLLSLPDQAAVAARPNGFGLGVEVQGDLGRGVLPGTPFAFGWTGAATTYVRMDPGEGLVAILLSQHFPYNEHRIFEAFAVGYYSALE